VQEQHARLDVLQGAGHGGLVDLEEADVAQRPGLPVRPLGYRGEQTREQIRARAVVNRSHPRAAQDV